MSDVDTDDPGIEWVRDFFAEHGVTLVGIASRNLSNHSAVGAGEDVVADVMIKLVDSSEVRRKAAAATKPVAYVTTMVKNKCIDYWRKQKRERENQPTVPLDESLHDDADGSADEVVDAVEAAELGSAINGAMASLTETERLAVIEVHLHGHSYAEIGRQRGVTGEAVRKAAAKGLAKLRDHPDLQTHSPNNNHTPT